MTASVVVVGAGYAGAALINEIAGRPGIEATWISERSHHVVKHEIHRAIRNPAVAEQLKIPVEAIHDDSARFHEGRVVSVDPNRQAVELGDGTEIPYDYLALTVGGRTAFYGIPGMREHAYTVSGPEDVRQLHDVAMGALESDDPSFVVGGGGLTGVQVAGELHELTTAQGRDAEITVVEALDSILPNAAPSLRRRVERALAARDIAVSTGAPVVEATDDSVLLDGEQEVSADLIAWCGGITGRDIEYVDGLERERNRLTADQYLRTSDPRIFAFGDAAAVEQPDGIAPPTAQAAWQAADIAAGNIIAGTEDAPLEPWTFTDKGTLVSIGESAFAHGVAGIPKETIGSYPAVFLKKAVAARWIASVDSWGRALRLWRYL